MVQGEQRLHMVLYGLASQHSDDNDMNFDG